MVKKPAVPVVLDAQNYSDATHARLVGQQAADVYASHS